MQALWQHFGGATPGEALRGRKYVLTWTYHPKPLNTAVANSALQIATRYGMREETPQLFWRSRRGNAVNPFYFAESDGCIKLPKWKVFWYGIDGFAEIERCVAHCGERSPTLSD